MAKIVFREYDQQALDAEYNNREVFKPFRESLNKSPALPRAVL